MGKPWYSGKKLEAAIKEILSARISEREKQYLSTLSVAAEKAPLLNQLDQSPQKGRT